MTKQKASDTYFGNGRAGVNPYENWERETRNPDVSEAPKGDGWCPVYVRLVAKEGAENPYLEAVGRVLRGILAVGNNLPHQERLTIDMVSLFFLLQAAGAENDRFASFFIWRRSSRAYVHVEGVFEVVHVGPESSTLEVCPPCKNEAENTFKELEKVLASGIELSLPGCDTSPVVTTVIDDQIGFAHERFRRSAKKTRVLGHFVHQPEAFLGGDDPLGIPGIIFVGGLLNEDSINNLLAENDEVEIYRKTDDLADIGEINAGQTLIEELANFFAPILLEKGFTPLREHRASHGTFITDLAAGHPVEDKVDGEVKDRPIMTFDLSRLSTADTSGTRLDVHSVLAVMFVTGVAHLFLKAKPAPMVINFSYALRAGPKDGTGFAENEMARLVRDRNNNCTPTWLVLPAGNGFRDQCHALLSPESSEDEEVEWRIQPGDQTPSYVEIWSDPVDGGTITISPPGLRPETIELAERDIVRDILVGGIPVARLFRQDVEGRVRITIAVAPTLNSDNPSAAAPSGAWIITAHAAEEGYEIHLDVQRDDTPDGFPRYGRQSYFDGANIGALDRDTLDYTAPFPSSEPVQREYTLSSYGTNNDDQVFVVGGAMDRDTLSQAALYSASGPSLGGRAAPELSAVSEETRTHPARLAAGMYSGSTAYYSGTSTSAALITRRIVEALSMDVHLDKSALVTELLAPKGPNPTCDLQLGFGTAPYQLEKGRPERRYRG